MTTLQKYTTFNTSSDICVSMSAVSHVINHKSNDDINPSQSCWIHFHSGKSVHVSSPFEEVYDDLVEFYKTRS